MIVVRCAGCKLAIKVKDELRGKRVKCPGCGKAVAVPAAGVPAGGPAASGKTAPEDKAPPPAAPAGADGPTLRPLAPAGAPPHESATVNTLADGESAPPDPELVGFLAPPQGPGEIGRLGPYRVLRVLGAGGMGAVYLAEDPALKRPVALKVVLPGLAASEMARQRFLREARVAASVKHDHVVTIYQVGEDRGVPFLAMEFLEGEPLDARLQREGRLPVPEVLRIGREMAEGLAAAHTRGLVHRDVKPANVWLEGEPGASATGGRVKILDFGVARAASQEGAQLTQQGAIIGTPSYMSPEQASGKPADARSDLFSLGCVLYRMATGQLPFQAEDTIATLLAVVTEEPPPPEQVHPGLPAPLCDLIRRLLSKNPNGRPPSAQAVAERLGELAGEATAVLPPGPRPAPSAGTRPRWVWLGVGAGVLALVAAVAVAAVLALAFLRRPGNLGGEGPPAAEALSPVALVAQPAPLPGVRGWTLETRGARGGTHALAFCPRDGRLATGGGDGTVRILDPATGNLHQCLVGHAYLVACLAWSPDGKSLASGSGDGTVRVWDVAAGRLLHTLGGHEGGARSVAWSPDGRRLASGGEDWAVRLWDADSGQPQATLRGHTTPVVTLAWSPDGKRLASGGAGRGAIVWDAASGKRGTSFLLESGQWPHPAWAPDGHTLVTADGANLRFWDADTGKSLRTIDGAHAGIVDFFAWSPDGKRLVTSGHDQALTFWDAASGRRLHSAAAGLLGGLAWAPDGRTVAFLVAGRAEVRDAASDKTVLPIPGHDDGARHGYLSPGGRVLAVENRDGSVRLWDPAAGTLLHTLTGNGTLIQHMAWSRDGRLLAVGSRTHDVAVWDAAAARRLAYLPDTSDAAYLAWSPDTKYLFVRPAAGPLRAVTVPGGQQRPPLQPAADNLHYLSWSPDGKAVAAAAEKGEGVFLWEAGFRRRTALPGHKGPVRAVAWSPDGQTLASAGDDGAVCLWDPALGRQRFRCTGHTAAVLGLAWSPDGKTLASAGDDGTARLWDPATGNCIRPLGGHPKRVARVIWSPDGTRLATLSDGQVRVWNAASGSVAYVLPEERILTLASWPPDGRTLITARGAGMTHIWGAATGRLHGTLVDLRNGQGLALGPEGHFRGPPNVEEELVCVVQTDAGQETLPLQEFARRFGWTNDPSRVFPPGG